MDKLPPVPHNLIAFAIRVCGLLAVLVAVHGPSASAFSGQSAPVLDMAHVPSRATCGASHNGSNLVNNIRSARPILNRAANGDRLRAYFPPPSWIFDGREFLPDAR